MLAVGLAALAAGGLTVGLLAWRIWPQWSRDGKELFYVRQGQVMSIPVETASSSFSFGSPSPLFAGRYQFASFMRGEPNRTNPHTYYDVDQNGHFVLIEPEASPIPNEVVVVLNWLDELQRQASNH